MYVYFSSFFYMIKEYDKKKIWSRYNVIGNDLCKFVIRIFHNDNSIWGYIYKYTEVI